MCIRDSHVVGVGFTAYAINVNIGVKTATKNAATIPLDVYKRQVL